jgi:hypothetical protein
MDRPKHSRPGPKASRAKLFANGRSQAVRLPREFRFEGAEVSIHREGSRVILEPIVKREWPAGYWRRIAAARRLLELGDVEPLRAGLLDIDEG